MFRTAAKGVVRPIDGARSWRGSIKFPSGVPKRWEKVTEHINHFAGGTRAVDEVTAVVKELRGKAASKAVSEQSKAAEVASPASLASRVAPSDKIERKGARAPDNPAGNEATTGSSAVAASGSGGPAAAAAEAGAEPAPAVASAAEEVVWSVEQQKALEAAMRKHGPAVAERWERISEEVPGMTKQDCVRRFKMIAAAMKAKKAAAVSRGNAACAVAVD